MNLPDTMRAAFIREPGGVDKIHVGELPVPTVGTSDVLVRVMASEINHVDLFVRSGAFPTRMSFPFVIGRDLVGTVAAVGADVTTFSKGQRVWCNSLGHDGRQGALAEYAVVPASRLYPLPSAVEPNQAAAMLHAAATAHLGLSREAVLMPGETVFVEGGGGSVGSAIVQMACAMGARVVTTASPADADWCTLCGADVVVDYHLPDCHEQIKRATPEGIDIWWDNSGHNNFENCLPLMNMHGRGVIMAGLQDANPVLPVGAMYTREISLHGFAISNATVADLADAAHHINRLFAANQLQARIGATYPLEQAAEAHQAMAEGRIRGRILVQP